MSNNVDLDSDSLSKLKHFCKCQGFELDDKDFFYTVETVKEKLNPQQYFDYYLIKKRLQDAVLFDNSAMSVSCNVHGIIDLHIVLKEIIDTPQFQRLRRLRQLGTTCFVYPTAMHTRFEHSIGVSFLAGQLANQLAEVQPELNISKKDILCVKIAGLCHDLGHGPFSHMFEHFIEVAAPGSNWHHEQTSCDIFDAIIRDNSKIKVSLDRCGIDETDIIFVKEMIGGIKKDLSNNDWQYKGRPREKGFLYEIVANNRFGLDVDKLDYLSRDSLNLGLSLVSANFDHKRIMHHLRVTKVGEDFLLSTRDKEHISMLKLFELRRQLFRTAYLHKTTVAVECMLLDAMLLANACIRTQNTKSKKEYKLCEIVQDLNAYCQLDDETLLSRIRTSSDDELALSRDLLCRIERRDLYQLIGESVYMHAVQHQEQEQSFHSKKYKKEAVLKALQDLLPIEGKDIAVAICVVNLGMRDQSPADYATYYPKTQPEHTVSLSKRPWLEPSSAMEEIIRVYSKEKRADLNQTTHALRVNAFTLWCEKESLPPPAIYGSPIKNKETLKREACASPMNSCTKAKYTRRHLEMSISDE